MPSRGDADAYADVRQASVAVHTEDGASTAELATQALDRLQSAPGARRAGCGVRLAKGPAVCGHSGTACHESHRVVDDAPAAGSATTRARVMDDAAALLPRLARTLRAPAPAAV